MRKPRAFERTADQLGPAAFIGFTLAGIVYIIAAKSLQIDAIWVTSVPVALMAAYAIAVYALRRLRLRDDQTGDNFYYMGFIFTLTSLAMALLQYGQDNSIDQIIKNFGVAIATTIAGIIFRILFNLARRDPVEVEHLSRLELADTSRRVRRELDDVILEFAHFRRSNQQMLAEGFEEIRAEVLKTAETASIGIAETARQSRERFSAEVQMEETRRISEELEKTAELLAGINASLAGINAATAELAETLDARRHLGFWARLRRLFDPSRPVRSTKRPVEPELAARPTAAGFATAIEPDLFPDPAAAPEVVPGEDR